MDPRERLRKACLFRAQHRGSREADMIIGGFARVCVETLSPSELDYFSHMLTWDDHDIFAWLWVDQDDGHTTLREKLLAFQDQTHKVS
jgi:antitoxin CptB